MSNPSDLVAINEMEFLAGLRIRADSSSAEATDRAIERHYRDRQLTARAPSASAENGAVPPVVRIQKLLFSEALRLGATDIHIDPGFRGSEVRYRVDGLLHDACSLPSWLHDRLAARIKVLARVDISERRLPQDGHFALVLRLLGDRTSTPTLASLGADAEVEDRLRAMGRRLQGIILVVGPTGSGKTTTLYALLEELHRRPLNIVTIEDPVEYHMNGIRQMAVRDKSRLTFDVALRSTLRQDPDIILAGEIRDRETARIAFEAAMTGHLVLSTLHCAAAVSALPWLEELGVARHLTAASLIGVFAQRLISRNCLDCARPDFPSGFYLERLGIRGGDLERLWRGYGCSACRFTGTRGRRALFEILEVDQAVRELVLAGREGEVRRGRPVPGFVPLADQAVEKALTGEIALEEACRSCYFGDSR